MSLSHPTLHQEMHCSHGVGSTLWVTGKCVSRSVELRQSTDGQTKTVHLSRLSMEGVDWILHLIQLLLSPMSMLHLIVRRWSGQKSFSQTPGKT